jgi:hypothetical protein
MARQQELRIPALGDGEKGTSRRSAGAWGGVWDTRDVSRHHKIDVQAAFDVGGESPAAERNRKVKKESGSRMMPGSLVMLFAVEAARGF